MEHNNRVELKILFGRNLNDKDAFGEESPYHFSKQKYSQDHPIANRYISDLEQINQRDIFCNFETITCAGKSDPYLTVLDDDEELYRTDLKTNTLNPEWNEQCVLQIERRETKLRFLVGNNVMGLL